MTDGSRGPQILADDIAAQRPHLAAVTKYWAVLRMQLQNNLAYPLDLLGRTISILLFLWIFVNLWRVTYSAAGEDVIAGLSLRDTLWYLMMAEAVILSKTDLSRIISEAVKDGSIAYLLNKPFNFIVYQFATGLGDSVLAFVVNAAAGSALIWWLVGPPPPVQGWLLASVAVLLAWFLDFCIASLIGLSAFVAEEVSAFRWVYQKLVFILGGLLIPIDFFPDWLQAIALRLPFAWTIYGPARLFVDPTWARFGEVVLMQGIWLGILGVGLVFFYRKMVGYLTINGG
ncbi:MAG: ABC-2 family transporter protein [Caldilineaceae bacterium]